MLRSHRLKQAIVLGVVASRALLAGMACADALEDAREAPDHQDQVIDQVIQQALSALAVKPASLSSELINPHPTFEFSDPAVGGAFRLLQLATPRPVALPLHDPPLAHRFKLFQFLSVYRL